MEHIKQGIENAIYGYDDREFFPITRDGQLENKAEFIAYKAEKFAGALGRIAHQTLETAVTVGAIVLDHVGSAS